MAEGVMWGREPPPLDSVVRKPHAGWIIPVNALVLSDCVRGSGQNFFQRGFSNVNTMQSREPSGPLASQMCIAKRAVTIPVGTGTGGWHIVPRCICSRWRSQACGPILSSAAPTPISASRGTRGLPRHAGHRQAASRIESDGGAHVATLAITSSATRVTIPSSYGVGR